MDALIHIPAISRVVAGIAIQIGIRESRLPIHVLLLLEQNSGPLSLVSQLLNILLNQQLLLLQLFVLCFQFVVTRFDNPLQLLHLRRLRVLAHCQGANAVIVSLVDWNARVFVLNKDVFFDTLVLELKPDHSLFCFRNWSH